MPQATIRCSVSNCHYWGQGNYCEAEEILITSDEIGKSYTDSFDAPVVSATFSTPVDHCMSTCCKTFVAKNTSMYALDGVKKHEPYGNIF